MLKNVFSLSLLLACSVVHASSLEQALLYPGAQVTEISTSEVRHERILLSAPKRVSNSLRFDKDVIVSGLKSVWLMGFDELTDELAVFKYYRQLLDAQGTQVFHCQERACGTSTDWANKIFSQAKLTARDSDQYYVAGHLQTAELSGWLAVYVVKNGRKEKLAYLSFVADKLPATGAGVVGSSPAWPLYLSAPELSEHQFDFIVKQLAQLPEQVLWISAHMRQEAAESGMAAAFAQQQAMLDKMRNFLASKADIGLDRVSFQSVGPFGLPPASVSTVYWLKLQLLRP